jgi:histidinol-phosphate aminotransferase
MLNDTRRSAFSRRSFLQASAAASVAASFGIVSEPLLAAETRKRIAKEIPAGAVVIDQNENPLGPCEAAREAITAIIPNGGRYAYGLTEKLVANFAEREGLPTDHVVAFPGSSNPLHCAVLAFTSAQKSYVTADPGYEAGMFASEVSGTRVIKVPLTKDYAHDVKAMIAAAPDAGLLYVCSPNNPTGTLTSHSDVEYLLEKKPKGSIVMVDEAYIHFSDGVTALDLVKAGKDIVVLRTFSKLYGMAGLRCGLAIGRPDLTEKIANFGGSGFMPVTAVVAASASLNDPQVVTERKRINSATRQQTFAWLDRNGYTHTPSQSNCFLLETKRPGKEVIAAMAAQNVLIGRIWPVWPTQVRITVGTPDEMARFQEAFQKVMSGAKAFAVPEEIQLRGRSRYRLS